ncbi:MarR family winged helix-turn-helix transcriptional regulator [uncultured Microbacterium sp.]|uniref:MarR family winged helix-turn-helix transcriptional regulator n=1 Tax=uncultured Microbacterium sp. TaxID=191216 RepID=UPI0035CBF64C
MSSDLTVKVQRLGASMQAYQAAVDDFDRECARLLGVNSTDLRCLEILVTEPDVEITPKMIAQRLNLTSGSVTTMLDRLERAGYAAREPHNVDRRKTVVRATPEAQQQSWRLIGPALEDGFAVSSAYSANDIDVVARFVTEVTDTQRHHVNRLREMPTPH